MTPEFLECLAPCETENHCFQAFHDRKDTRSPPSPILHGSFAQHREMLAAYSAAGYGVFWTVNRTDGVGRSKENISRVRCLWLDIDEAGRDYAPVAARLQPHCVVESSQGKHHLYWRVGDCALGDFEGLLDQLTDRWAGDRGAKGVNRVLRLPGFAHQKGASFMPRVVSWMPTTTRPYTVAEVRSTLLAGALAPPPRATNGTAVNGDGPRADWSGPASDEELLRRAMQSRSSASKFGGSGPSFADLWHADAAVLAAAYPDPERPYNASQADAALCQHLAFWCGCHHERVDRLIRQSGLVRDKYDRDDYLLRTIAKACAQQVDVLQDKLSADEVVRQLAPLDAAALARDWPALAAQLSPEHRASVIEFVAARTGVGKQPLKEALREHRAIVQREALAVAAARRAGARTVIEFKPEDLSQQAAAVEQLITASALPGEYVAFSGVLCHVVTKALPYTHLIDAADNAPPAVIQIEPLDRVAIRERVERVALFSESTKAGPKPIEVPSAIFEILIQKKAHAAPIVNGLVTHPVVLHDGSILSANGLHAKTGLYLSGVHVEGPRPYAQSEAATALDRLRESFLSEFEFASPLDADVALAGLFTGVQRRLMDSAPGLAVLASTQSSGKTTLARRMHVVLTGRDMPVSTFPEGNEDEAQKRLLSMLLRSPVMICLDNISDGFTFRSGSLAAAMTSSSFTQRVLGVSRDADCLTNTLFVMTGNNLSFGRDEASRWIASRLAPTTARPEQRVFRYADVLAHGLAIREQSLRDAVGIVAGFLSSGVQWQTRSRFPAWDRFVRQPLGWAGACDVAAAFDRNAESSEDARAHRTLLACLRELFADREFTAGEVSRNQFIKPEISDALSDSLIALGAKDATTQSARSIGKVFAKLLDRVVELDGAELRLRGHADRKGVLNYRCR